MRKRPGVHRGTPRGFQEASGEPGRQQVSLCEATVCPKAENRNRQAFEKHFLKTVPARPSEAGGARPSSPGSAGTSAGGPEGTEWKQEGRGATTLAGSASPAAYWGRTGETCAEGRAGTAAALRPGIRESPSPVGGGASQAPLGDHEPGARARPPAPPGRPRHTCRRVRDAASPSPRPLSGARAVSPQAGPDPPARLTRDACRDPPRSPAVGVSALCARGPRSRLSPEGRGPGAAPLAAPPARPARCARAQDGCGRAPGRPPPPARPAPPPVRPRGSRRAGGGRAPPPTRSSTSFQIKVRSLFVPVPLPLANFAEFGSTPDGRGEV